MKAIRIIAAIAMLGAASAVSSGDLDLSALELERSCGNCHDVRPSGLTSEDWLARMQALGPVDSLEPDERAEVVGFLRHHGWEVNQILALSEERFLFEEKCGLCHSVQRAFLESMDSERFRTTVLRMRARAPQWISEEDVETIIDFMAAGARGVPRPEHPAIDAGPAEVFRHRCAGCHPLERSYLYLETELDPAWPLLVKRMQLKAPEWISDDEAGQIVEYLSGLEPQLR